MKYCLNLLIAASFLSGCANRIEQPVASVPLIETAQDVEGEPVPQFLWSQLDQSSTGTAINLSNQEALLGARYYSAAGGVCRFLTWSSSEPGYAKPDRVCKAIVSNAWHFPKPVIASFGVKQESPNNGQ